jgi:hypothetical protein
VAGQLTVPLPPYLQAEHDEDAKKVHVRVDDSAEKHQRAMWGVYHFSTPLLSRCKKKKRSGKPAQH